MKRVLYCLAVFVVVLLARSLMVLAAAQISMIGSPSQSPPLPADGSVILWDQTFSNSFGVASQDFVGTANSAYDVFCADDFTAGQNCKITAIHVMGMVGSGSGMSSASALHWEIYENNLGVPAGYPGGGAPLWSISLPPSDPRVTLRSNNTGVSLYLTTPVSLSPGNYWLVFYPTMDQQWFWATAVTNNLEIAQIINPGLCFGCGPYWTSIQTCAGASDHDLAFRLDGTQSGTGSLNGTIIPTLNQWGLLLFVTLLAAVSFIVIRRRVMGR